MQATSGGAGDAFVAKFATTGTVTYASYLGGAGTDTGAAIAVDTAGNTYVTGSTSSTNLPGTSIHPIQAANGGGTDAFLSKVIFDGSALAFTTYLGGTGTDQAAGVAVDATGAAVVVGSSTGGVFPTLNAIQATNVGTTDSFVARVQDPLLAAPVTINVAPGGNQTFASSGGAGQVQLEPHAVSVARHDQPDDGPVPRGPDAQRRRRRRGDRHRGHRRDRQHQRRPRRHRRPREPDHPPQGTQMFVGSGGGNTMFQYTISANGSGGTIDLATGLYKAGTASKPDVLRVFDRLGNSGTTTVVVGPNVSISPATPVVNPSATQLFTASGGSGMTYTWLITTNGSGGTINKDTGSYTAGPSAGTVDIIQLTDSLLNSTSQPVSVGAGLANYPAVTLPPLGTESFLTIGGSGTGLTWSIPTNLSGGSIGATTGAYTAGTKGASSTSSRSSTRRTTWPR